MARLNKIKAQVEYELEKYPSLRDDDFMLISAIYVDFYEVGILNTFCEVMENHKEMGLPSFESIRRTRQKIQEEGRFLPSAKMKEVRKNEEYDFYDFAKGF